jgi:hypothetical protein
VRFLLSGGSADTAGADPVADGVELVEPLEHAHAQIIPQQARPGGLTLQNCYVIAYM